MPAVFYGGCRWHTMSFHFPGRWRGDYAKRVLAEEQLDDGGGVDASASLGSRCARASGAGPEFADAVGRCFADSGCGEELGDAGSAGESGGESSVLPGGDAGVRNESASGHEADADVGIWRDVSWGDV